MLRLALGAAGGGLLLLALAANGLPPLPALAAAACFAVAFLPIGWLLTSRIGGGLLSVGERVVLALLVGHVAVAVLAFVASALGLSLLVWPALALAAVAAARQRRPAASLPPAARAHVSWPLLVPICLFAVTLGNPAFQTTPAGLQYVRSADHAVHLSHYGELRRGVPPEQIPWLAGTPFPRYHVLGYMPGLLLVRAGLLDVVTVVHEVAPAMRLCLLMGALYLVVRLRTGDGRLAAAALPAMMIVGHAVESLLARHIVRMPPSLSYMVRSESGAAGLVVWATVFALLAVHERAPGERGSRALLLAAAVAGVSFGFKTHFFTLFAGPFLIAVGIVFLRERSRRLLLALAVTVGGFLAVFLAWPTHESYGGVALAPGAFARTYLAMSLEREPSPGLRRVLSAVYGDLATPAGAAAATLLAVARVTLFSPLVPAFVVRVARRFRTASVLDLAAMLVFPAFVAMASLLGARWIEGDTTGIFLAQVARGVTLTSSVVTYVAAAVWALPSPRRTRVLLAAVLVASVALIPALRPAEVRPGPLLDSGRRCTLAFLRDRTPLDAVVLDASANGESSIYAEVAGLAGRRSVLEHVSGRADPRHDRLGDLRLFYRTDDAVEATRILDRYTVDYVLERPEWPLRFPKNPLRLVFERQGHRVYATRHGLLAAEAASTTTPGRLLPLLSAWPALACP